MRIQVLSGGEVGAMVDGFARVYRAAFAGEPYHRQEPEVAEFARALPLQIRREAFRAVVAVADGSPEPVGIAYGYRSLPGQWWHDNVGRVLGDGLSKLWLADAFQVTEVAVVPEHQHHGIGAGLLDALLAGLPHERAVLSTLDAPTVGRAMYLGRGWQDLLTGFYFPGVARRYAIMGRVLTRGAG